MQQVEEFLEGAEGTEFRAEGRTQRYALFEALLEQISNRLPELAREVRALRKKIDGGG